MKSQVLYSSIAVIILQIFSKTQRAKREVLKNEKCTWSSRDLQQFLNHKSFAECFIKKKKKKKKKKKFASSYGVCLQKGEQEPLVYYGKVLGIRRVSRFSRKYLQIPVSCWQMLPCTINQTELINFRLPGISDAGIQRSVAYTDGQRNRYVLL